METEREVDSSPFAAEEDFPSPGTLERQDEEFARVQLDEGIMNNFRVARVFRDNEAPITTLDFSADGYFLIVSSEDESMVVYDSTSGCYKKTIHSKKYGANLARFTHSNHSLIHASTKLDHSIRYLSIHDTKYIRYFSAHSDRVVSLCMCPTDDTFLSASSDKTIRIWDLRQEEACGIVQVDGSALACYDPEGLIFVSVTDSKTLRLYDKRSLDTGPFSSFTVGGDDLGTFQDVKFSPDGSLIEVTTSEAKLRLVDSFSGHTMCSIDCIQTSSLHEDDIEQHKYESCFTPNSSFILTGSGGGDVCCTSVKAGSVTKLYESFYDQPFSCIAFSPKHVILATSCKDRLLLWLPDPGDNVTYSSPTSYKATSVDSNNNGHDDS